jgi:hypothetical protein
MASRKCPTHSRHHQRLSAPISATQPVADPNERVASWIDSQTSMDGSMETAESWRQRNPEMVVPSQSSTQKKWVRFARNTLDNEGKTARKYGMKVKRCSSQQSSMMPTLPPSILPFVPDPPRSREMREPSNIRQTPTFTSAMEMQEFESMQKWVPPIRRGRYQSRSTYFASRPAASPTYAYQAAIPPTPRPVRLPTPELKELDCAEFCVCGWCDAGWESKIKSQSKQKILPYSSMPNSCSGICSTAYRGHQTKGTAFPGTLVLLMMIVKFRLVSNVLMMERAMLSIHL